MSRPSKTQDSKPKHTYSVERFEGGYLINKYTIQDNKVISVERISESDVFAITQAKLIQYIRKALS